tara:strand:+ start:435 stop:1106 length:672 start_codon:yes stop_codon:yes gene_type:complete
MMMKLLPPTQIDRILEKVSQQDTFDPKELLKGTEPSESINNFDFDLLESHKIFHLDQIKEVCIDYRLRFLDLKYFKGNVPKEAIAKISALEKNHDTALDNFKVMAPSVLFRLKKADDPLLFVPLGNKYFYLIHKWGDDLSFFRKAWAWSFKNIWNLLITVMVVSFFATLITPYQIFTKSPTPSTFWMLFFFMFKAIASIVLFYGFALGKNFNPAIWNNRYDKT